MLRRLLGQAIVSRAASLCWRCPRGMNLRKHTDVLGDADHATSKTSGIDAAIHHGQTVSFRDIARRSQLRHTSIGTNV
jgi:hypothetical protein